MAPACTRLVRARAARSRCDEECIRRIAARLCRLDEHAKINASSSANPGSQNACTDGCCAEEAPSITLDMAGDDCHADGCCASATVTVEGDGCCAEDILSIQSCSMEEPGGREKAADACCAEAPGGSQEPGRLIGFEATKGIFEKGYTDGYCDDGDSARRSLRSEFQMTGPLTANSASPPSCTGGYCGGQDTESGTSKLAVISSEACVDPCCSTADADPKPPQEATILEESPKREDGCCSIEDGCPKDLGDENASSSSVCVNECCGLPSGRTVDQSDSACSAHFQAAFTRFDALLQKGKCLCKTALQELNFCCCKVTPDGLLENDSACNSAREQPTISDTGSLKHRASPRKMPGGRSAQLSDEFKHFEVPSAVQAHADIEKSAAREQVVLTVSGMTCTGCSRKMQNVLDRMPGVQKTKVTFVSGSTVFELDNSVAKLEDLLPDIEKKTGFKCSRVVSEHQQLDVLVSPAAAAELSDVEGVVSVERIKKEKHRITYNPYLVGARDLMPASGRLDSPVADAGATEVKQRLMKTACATGIAAVFTTPVVVLNWSDNPVDDMTRSIISLVLATAVQLIAVPEFYVGALKSLLFSRIIEMDMLVVISITAAYGYSIVAFGLTTAGVALEQEAFFEMSTLLITLVLLGRLLAAIARVRAIAAVTTRSLQAETTLLCCEDGETKEIDSRLLHFHDVIKVLPHTRIVTDGIVSFGASAVDESMITGESEPVAKQTGNSVTAGTVNGSSALRVRINRLHGANSITDIAGLVQDALSAKPRMQDLADRVASWFIPAVVGVAMVVFAIWIGIAIQVRGKNVGGAIGTAITYGIAVLAVSCPCALGLAVPMVLVIAGGVAARAGVVIKAADAVERGFRVTDVVFDKTGTLTRGDLSVATSAVLTVPSATGGETLGLAKALVQENRHPVSATVESHLNARDVELVADVQDTRSIPGCGVQAFWDELVIKVGNPHWLGVQDHQEVCALFDRGMTAFCMTINGKLSLVIGLKSTIRDEAAGVIANLEQRGVNCHIVSGDNTNAVRAVAAALNVDTANIAARHLPADKRRYVQTLQTSSRTVLFCGDGTNDAVAIAQANVGVQMGRASDVTSAVADVVLLGELDGVVTLLDLSKRAFARIRFNFVWTAMYNLFAILLAAGAFVKVRIEPAYAGIGEIVSVGPVIFAAATLAMRRKRS